MITRHSPAAVLHDPHEFFRRGRIVAHPESVARYDILLGAAAAGGDIRPAGDAGMAPIAAVHDADYLDLLQHGHARAAAADPALIEAVPSQFAPWQPHRRPGGLYAQLGYHMTDTSTPLRAGTWPAIYGAAQAAIAAADDALAPDTPSRAAYALCRPPGHHASSAHAGGFCYLNNAAIAAQHLVARTGRVAILDVDVHHGNGTQAIFADRDDVMFVSIHADPSDYFPYFSGYADECGAGAGEGFTLNLPLPLGTGDAGYGDAVERGMDRIGQFGAAALVVSLGLDASIDDPIGGFAVTTSGFSRVAAIIARFTGPVVLVQEGGYPSAALARNLTAFLTRFAAGRRAWRYPTSRRCG